MEQQMIDRLFEAAKSARDYSYSPYSDYAVGAALLAKSGKIYTGVNVENASFSATNCAERTAIFKAVSEGEKEFEAIAIAGGKAGDSSSADCTPCGVCRQVLAEFCDEDFNVIVQEAGKPELVKLGELLPMSFSKEDLE